MACVEKAGGVVVGVGALIDRSGGTARFPVKQAALANVRATTWKPEDCPLCKEGTPAVKPGSRTWFVWAWSRLGLCAGFRARLSFGAGAGFFFSGVTGFRSAVTVFFSGAVGFFSGVTTFFSGATTFRSGVTVLFSGVTDFFSSVAVFFSVAALSAVIFFSVIFLSLTGLAAGGG